LTRCTLPQLFQYSRKRGCISNSEDFLLE
jgi:hypothetical protein